MPASTSRSWTRARRRSNSGCRSRPRATPRSIRRAASTWRGSASWGSSRRISRSDPSTPTSVSAWAAATATWGAPSGASSRCSTPSSRGPSGTSPGGSGSSPRRRRSASSRATAAPADDGPGASRQSCGPPVAQALNMPGWFERHFDNMRRYPYLMAVGALVGTEGNAHVACALTGGPEVVYEPTPGDRRKLADALIELGRILFAAGAKRIMVNTWNYYEFTDPNQLSELIRVTLDPEELVLGTGHPQGGNAISASPEWGVVGPDFRVHGWENLYVCDASVIPSSLTVNPQLTIMTLAHYAAPRIAGRP